MSYYTGFAGLAKGIASGLALNEQKQREDEQLARQQEQQQYERKRQAVADQQNAELHTQTVQGNKYKLQDMEQEAVQNKRKQYLTDQVGRAIQMRDAGDVDSLYSLYGDVVNNQTLGDPKTGMYAYKVEKQPDGTANINAYDRTGQLVQTTAKGITADQIIGTIYGQINPAGTYATEQQSRAEKAKADREWQEKVGLKKMDILSDHEKMRVQNIYRRDELQYSTQLGMGRDNNQSQNRIGEKAFEYRFNPQTQGNTSKVSNMVQGALSYVQQNPAILQGLSPEEQQLAIANIAIESGGNPNAVSPVGARGLMQIMPIARTDVMQRGAADPYASPLANAQGGMVQLRRLVQKYNGDMGKAIAANNWGEGNLDKHIKKYGDNWTQGLPKETASHLERFAQAHEMLKTQQTTAPKLEVASLIGARIDPLTKQVAADFKGSELAAPQIRGALNQVSSLLSQSLATNDINKRKVLYSQAGQVVVNMLANSGLTPREQYSYRDTVLQGLLGENDLASVGSKMGFTGISKTVANNRADQQAPSSNKRASQRQMAKTGDNPFIDPDAKLFEQSPDVDRSIVNGALRGG